MGESLINCQRGKVKGIQLRTRDETELCGEFWRNLRNHVTTQVAGFELSVTHQMVDCVWDLHQLAFGQVWKGRDSDLFISLLLLIDGGK